MIRPRLLALLVLLVAVAAVAAWFGLRRDGGRPTALVTRQRLEQTIETTGSLQPVEVAAVSSRVAGSIAVVAVRPGDRVQRGDIVAQLDPAPYQSALDAATADADAAELALSVAEQAAASGDVKTRADALAAAQRVDRARAAVAAAQRALVDTIVVALTAGTVLDVPVHAGQPVQAGAPIASVLVNDALQVVADLDEVDVPRVGAGAPVRITVDAFPAAALTGHVVAVAPAGTNRGGGTVFPATVAVDGFGGLAVRPGMTVSLAIPSAVAENALAVPADAVKTVGRRAFVTVVRDGHDTTVEISTGLRASGLVEVTRGDLHPGDRVLLQR